MMASFSALTGDFPSIALIVLHSLEGSVLWSSVSMNCLHVSLRCAFVVLVITSFICCRAGEVGSLDLRSSRALILSSIPAGTGSVLIRCRPEGICRDAAFRMMVRNIFSPFWQFVGVFFCSVYPLFSLRYRSQFAFFFKSPSHSPLHHRHTSHTPCSNRIGKAQTLSTHPLSSYAAPSQTHIHISHTPPTPPMLSTSAALDTIPEPRVQPRLLYTPIYRSPGTTHLHLPQPHPHLPHQHCYHPRTLSIHTNNSTRITVTTFT